MNPRILALSSVVFFLFCCCVDLILGTIDGDHSLPVQVEFRTKNNVNIIEGVRVSPSGKHTPLNQKFIDEMGTVIIRYELPTVYYAGVGISVPDTVSKKAIANLAIRIGDQYFKRNTAGDNSNWQIEKEKGKINYIFYGTRGEKYSVLPPFKKVINWAGDQRLVQITVIDNLPLLVLLLFISFLYTKTGKGYAMSCQRFFNSSPKGLYLISFLLIVYRMPFTLQPIGAGVDMSWMVGLNWARNKNLAWGKDIVFTYGPYYWLLVSSLVLTHKWLIISFVSTISIFSVSVLIIINKLAASVKSNKLSVQLAIFLVLLIVTVNYGFMDLVLISVLLLLSDNPEKEAIKKIIPAVFFLAIISLTKFSYLAASLGILSIFTFYELINRRVWSWLSAWISFVLLLVILWVIAGQRLENMVGYLTNSLAIASGYSEAMATPFWKETGASAANFVNLLFLGVAILIFLSFSVFLIKIFKQGNQYLYAALLAGPVLFLAFKEGYVRFDKGHFTQFFEQVLLVVVFLVIVIYRKQNTYSNALILGFVGLICLSIVEFKRPNYQTALLGVFSESKHEELLAKAKKDLQKEYPLSITLKEKINNKSKIDVLPWDISLLYAYGMDWQPRPVMQSYSVYTSALDVINANHFRSDKAPELALYTFKTIDDRNPIFDEPLVLPELLNKYTIDDQSDKTYLLLKKKSIASKAVELSYQQSKKLKVGQPVIIPHDSTKLTFARINVELTLIGKLMNLLFKVPPLTIEFKNGDNLVGASTRLIRQTAADGLLVSPYVASMANVRQIWAGLSKPNVTSITIKGSDLFYKEGGTIAFSK